MNQEVIEAIVQRLNEDIEKNILHEHKYKVEASARGALELKELLAESKPWPGFFRSSNSFMTNQLGWRAVAALSALAARYPDEFGEMVRRIFEDGDMQAGSGSLDELLENNGKDDVTKTIWGLGTRASLISYFMLLREPTQFPIFRSRLAGDAMRAIFGKPLPGKSAPELLENYYQSLDELLETFQSAGLPIKDRLDVQAVMYKAKEADLVGGGAIHSIERTRRLNAGGDGGNEAEAAETLLVHTDGSKGTAKHLASATEVAAALPVLKDWLRGNGLHYPDRLLAHYLSALLTKPFVVLSGLSGSGKTQLALRVGETLGKVFTVPVKPDWTDTRGVLGYLNPLTGRYDVTQALAAVLHAHSTGEPTTLLLDEMNLAHVERYFADVLSAMESAQPIPLHDSDEVEDNQGIPQQLNWPQNLFVVGTVNVDETTYPFSPKVLDRAFVIDVSHVDIESYMNSRASGGENGAVPRLPAFQPDRRWRRLELGSRDLAFIGELHAQMTEGGRPFGYRTIDESLAFLAHARAFQGRGLHFDAQDALIISKILPRLHGRRHELMPLIDGMLEWVNVDPNAVGERDDPEAVVPPAPEALRETVEALLRIRRILEDEGHIASLVG